LLAYDPVMQARFKHLLLLVLIFQYHHSWAQKFSFNRIPPPKNSPFSLIAGMSQDSLGYMWFVSGPALYRYDGYNFTIFHTNKDNPKDLKGHTFECMYIDRKGIIWIGDQFEGLNRFNPSTATNTYYEYEEGNLDGISAGHISVINEDQDGNIWIGTTKGIDILNPETGRFSHLRHNPRDTRSLSCDNVHAIYRDKSNTMWIGTGEAFHKAGEILLEGGLNRYDPETKSFTRFVHNPSDPTSLSDNRVRSILEDSHGNFWVGVAGQDGLHTLDRKSGQFKRYIYDPAHPERLSRTPQRRKLDFADDHIPFIHEDVTGAIWIGTFLGGLTRYDADTKKATHFYQGYEPGSINEMGSWSMFTSKDGMLWLGSWEDGLFGLYTINPLDYHYGYIPLGHAVYAIAEQDSLIYLAGQGLTILDNQKKFVRSFFTSTSGELKHNVMNCIYPDRNGSVWIGTDGKGLLEYNPRKQTFKTYEYENENNGLIDGFIMSLLEDSRGNFWVGTGNGLQLMDRKTGKFKYIRREPNDEHKWITAMLESNGEMYIGMYQDIGLLKFNRDSLKFESVLDGVSVNCIYEDSQKTIWVGTNTGIYYKTVDVVEFARFTDKNFLHENLFVKGISEDDNKNLWVSTPAEFFVINPDRSQSQIHPSPGSSVNEFSLYRQGIKLKSGELLYGNESGLNVLHPGEYAMKITRPVIVINNFTIHDYEKPGLNEEIMTSPLNETGMVSLEKEQNNFSISFSGIHFKEPKGNRHLYMLEGYDNEWRRPASDHTASFTNIPPGFYRLRLAVSNSNGVWVEREIQITIAPEWWNTWWFRIGGVVALLVLSYSILRWRLNVKFKRQLERSQKEKILADLRHRTSELEIHALRAQMNPHFIFNSLNSINRFILQNNRTQASEYLTKFSKLVRMVFHNSQSALVTLESEIEALQLYLELEAVRFDNHFDYSITVDEELDAAVLKIPPLIIQPYAENAIWHGLMHKEERGKLDIAIYPEGEVLVCRIKDDGIGRKLADEIKGRSLNTHKSMGMRITADRIALLQQQNMLREAIQINDLVLDDGTPGGTEIILKMPLRND
jgi:ligand-binding sensor domain-containing protein